MERLVSHSANIGNSQRYILFDSTRRVPNGHWQLWSIWPVWICLWILHKRRQRSGVREQFESSSVSTQRWPSFSIVCERHWQVLDNDEHSYNWECEQFLWHFEPIVCSNSIRRLNVLDIRSFSFEIKWQFCKAIVDCLK